MITTQENKLIYTFNQETVLIEPWGKHAIRVRAIKQAAFPEENWALTQPCTHSGICSVFTFQPRIGPVVEQPCVWSCGIWKEPDEL